MSGLSQMHMSEKAARQLGAALLFLSKNGKDITMEATPEGLVLRSLNDAKNAFAAAHFQREFFDDYRPPEAPPQKAKFTAKSALQAFRSMKHVESLRIYFAEQNCAHFLVFQFKAKHDVTRTHSMTYEDTEVLTPMFSRHDAPHHCICRPGMLARLVDHIKASDDVSLVANPSKVEFRSYFPVRPEDNSARGNLHTAMSIAPGEFDRFHLGEDEDDGAAGSSSGGGGGNVHTDVTFSLKALRALLVFAEDRSVQSEEVAIFFGPTASPVGVSTEGVLARAFRAELVLATLQKSVVEGPPPPPQQAAEVAAPPQGVGAGGPDDGGAQKLDAESAGATTERRMVDGSGDASRSAFTSAAAVNGESGRASAAATHVRAEPRHGGVKAGSSGGSTVPAGGTRGFPADAIVRRTPHAHAQMLTQQSDAAGGSGGAVHAAPFSALRGAAPPPASRLMSVVSILGEDDSGAPRTAGGIQDVRGRASAAGGDASDFTRAQGGAACTSLADSSSDACMSRDPASPALSADPDSSLLDGCAAQAGGGPSGRGGASSSGSGLHNGLPRAAHIEPPPPQQQLQQRVPMSLTQPQAFQGSGSQEF